MCTHTRGEETTAMQPCPPRSAPYWLDLGDVAVVPLVEVSRLPIDPAEFFPGSQHISPTSWCFDEPWFENTTANLVFTIQAFLVVTGSEVILIDGCVGSGKPRNRSQFDHLDPSWFTEFTNTGFTPEDVSTVVLSHLHVDHVGWTTRRTGNGWSPVFGNARHLVSQRELAYWSGPDGRAAMARTGDYLADSIEPLTAHGLLDFAEGGHEIGRHVDLLDAPGHTPGNLCVRVRGSKAELLLAGDLLHHPLQLVDPDISTRYCVDPNQAATTRRDLLAAVTTRGAVLQTAHFAGISASRLNKEGSRYTLTPATDIVRAGQYRRP